ncbi:hypothetical protein ACFWBN_02070 [Streptomyces sp. NPDC059989]|uniref:hypothetical protein n=1 Tax=Streptomyces sp. NPDC059989 TaxID=3347026 RepID=UPI0036B81667
MPWNWLQIRLHPARPDAPGYGESTYGRGGFTYQEARSEIQKILDRLTIEYPRTPAYTAAAVAWRKGGVPDDTLTAALLVSRVYEYEDGRSAADAAQEWLLGFSMRVTGEPHRVIVSPTAPGGVFGR